MVWTYDVHARGALGADLDIEATFAPTTTTELTTDDDLAAFVGGVEFFTMGRWEPAPTQGSAWTPSCLRSGCRVRYTFALGKAASTLEGVDTAMAAGGLVIAPPSTWLLRPSAASSAPAEERWRFRVTGAPFATGVARSATAPDFFEARTSDLDAAAFAVFGPFQAETIQSGGARVDLAIAPTGLAMTASDAKGWVERAVAGIAAYYGNFPVSRTLVIIVPGRGSETEGETLGDGGPSVVVRPPPGLTAAATRDDWVVTHELLHVTLPSLEREHAWLSEGIATYVEPIVRARAGLLSAERFWSELLTGLPRGLPERGDQGLERTHTWGRTYWGGALFCLVADVRIRARTAGMRSFDDVLRGISATGANVASHWSIDRFLAEGDRATGVTVLRELYREMALAPGGPDLGSLFRRLGVKVGTAGRAAFDEGAELAAVRRGIVPQAAGPRPAGPLAPPRPNSTID